MHYAAYGSGYGGSVVSTVDKNFFIITVIGALLSTFPSYLVFPLALVLQCCAGFIKHLSWKCLGLGVMVWYSRV